VKIVTDQFIPEIRTFVPIDVPILIVGTVNELPSYVFEQFCAQSDETAK
jgi:hypothetical protein